MVPETHHPDDAGEADSSRHRSKKHRERNIKGCLAVLLFFRSTVPYFRDLECCANDCSV